jgi:hypothetical protein
MEQDDEVHGDDGNGHVMMVIKCSSFGKEER